MLQLGEAVTRKLQRDEEIRQTALPVVFSVCLATPLRDPREVLREAYELTRH